MRYNAGNAVANGLDWRAGLAAITINPARIFGLADRVGSLEAGKDGDVVVWDGDPLDTLTRPVAVLIRGERQPMTSRATELRDRYLPAILAPIEGETPRSEEHTSELQSLMRISYAVFGLKTKKQHSTNHQSQHQ